MATVQVYKCVCSTNEMGHLDCIACVYVCVYRGYRVEGILYGQQEDLVATVGVVSVGRPGDSLGCGVIKVRLLA